MCAHTCTHTRTHSERQTHSRGVQIYNLREPNAGKIFKMKQESFLTTVEKKRSNSNNTNTKHTEKL